MPERSDLDAIAAELYVLPPAEFTAARNARAGMADRSIAAQVKGLRKPTVAAWTVNLLARGGRLGEALELSAALREAQDDLDAAELSRLGRQRRALVAALATQAAGLAKDAGVAVSAAARDDVEKTINAAVMDAAAAAAVMTGRLVSPLEAGAFEEADLVDAVGGSLPGVAAPRQRDDLAERRARKAAEKAAREAERLANEAERELARIDAQRTKLQERVDHVSERIDDLRRDLERLEAEQAKAQAALGQVEEERGAAASRARSAAKDAERARDALDG
ncbi:transposase [Microbacterium sp. CFH 31415]|uniref:transposase n=1 Tax=Microbacterium sp. CFH 31415 TaxID=2921732 RepID=UPI001F140229|nr:transposase [Microbacterium sp. CFH 31415]MCH6231959.1 transposase [Microbacterium sp. CFH 31415]